MRKTIYSFVLLLALCLIIGACSQQAEVEEPAAETPMEEAVETAEEMVDSLTMPDSTMLDSIPVDSLTGHEGHDH